MIDTPCLPSRTARIVLSAILVSFLFPVFAFSQLAAPVESDGSAVARQRFDDDVRVPDGALPVPEAVISGDPRIDALASGYKWPTTTLTYSFYSDAAYGGRYYGTETGTREVSAGVKQNVREILAFYQSLLNLTLVEVPETPTTVGQIRVMLSDQQSYAHAYFPSGNGTGVAGDVHLNPTYDRLVDTNGFQNGPGAHGYLALIHELGHAFGLKHPHSNTPNLPAAEDNYSNTVMSYNFPGAAPGTLMAYDMLALQFMYGARAQRTGDDSYAFTRTAIDQYSVGGVLSLNRSSGTKQTIWDAGGYNTLDLSGIAASSAGYRLDLKPFGWLTALPAYQTTYYDTGTSLGPGVRIMRVVSSPGADTIYANAEANVFAGYLPGRPTGADVIVDASSADRIDLSAFAPGQVAQTASGSDLVLGLGSGGSITVKNYYAGARPAIVFGSATPQLTISDVSVAEGNGGATQATFVVTLSSPASAAVAVSYTTANGTAVAGTDYTAAAGTLSFTPGQTQTTISVAVLGDTVVESDETFAVLLAAPSAGVIIGDAQGNGTILNDDQAAPSPGPGGAATFLALDTSTQGDWIGRYGSQAYLLPNVGSGGAAASMIAASGAAQWTWAASTADRRALQRPDGSGRAAATMYGGTFSIDVSVPDSQSRRLTVYCLDWDGNQRVQLLEMVDRATGVVLDRRTLSNFSAGQHLAWLVSGNVRLRVSSTGGPNAVVGGVFVDAGTVPSTSNGATFVGSDVSTRGNWQGTYGKDGYVLANDRTASASYASVVPGGQASWTWTPSSADVRALVKGDGTGRLAATWFSSTGFWIDINTTDGRSHRVAIYCVDWDANQRTQTVEVLDASTGAVLDRRTLSAFTSGQYLVWSVRGAVRLRVTTVSGPNAVVSGVFLDTP